MTHHIVKIITTACICILGFAGCAATQNRLGKEYPTDVIPNHKTYFSQLSAVEKDGAFRVSGELRLRANGGNVFGYVEVALVEKDGSLMEIQKVAYHPRILNGIKRHRTARFTARFTQAPPFGTTIRLGNVD